MNRKMLEKSHENEKNYQTPININDSKKSMLQMKMELDRSRDSV